MNKTTTVYLVRHAHAVYIADENRHLSSEGMKAANKLLPYINSLDVIYSSPYRRAIETISPIAKNLKLEVHELEGLKERQIADDPVDDFSLTMEQLWSNWHHSLKGGESNYTAQARIVSVLKTLLNTHLGGNIALSLHGNIMVLLMAYYDAHYNYEFWKKLKMPAIYKMSFTGEEVLITEVLNDTLLT